ncbi:MAG: penicillin-binding protein 2 [Kistimonas sp.]|nr:penicillin-binding protein 2 [Kistimonas sp.]
MSSGSREGGWRGRYLSLQGLIVLAMLMLCGRVVTLHLFNRDFLQREGDKRTLREEKIPAYRGLVLDRHGHPLAVSTPVVSLWTDPRILARHENRWPELRQALGARWPALETRLREAIVAGRHFMWIRRSMTPVAAQAILDRAVPGVHGRPEYRRYYPAGKVAAHLVGLTDIDDVGQEGMELALDDWLTGVSGVRRVLKDRRGQVIREPDLVRSAEPGREVHLALDIRLQYLAYRELERAVRQHRARAASLVMLDARTGEVLAMVNQPASNPNNRASISPLSLRNRAITDEFEPGSVVKPLVMAAALQSKRYSHDSRIRVSPGYLRVGRSLVRDHRDYGTLDLAGILQHSSNVGLSRLALDLGAESLVSFYQQLGLGQITGVIFPGEAAGSLPVRQHWAPIETATLSFGYGVTVTMLQLARAYMVLANQGQMLSVSLLRRDEPAQAYRVISADVAAHVLTMMQKVVREGTARRARIAGYKVAGKTGTTRKLEAGKYSSKEHRALFAGVVPADRPRIVMVVMVDAPREGGYYGGLVAAPVFAQVARGTLRLLGVPPDGAPDQARGLEAVP